MLLLRPTQLREMHIPCVCYRMSEPMSCTLLSMAVHVVANEPKFPIACKIQILGEVP